VFETELFPLAIQLETKWAAIEAIAMNTLSLLQPPPKRWISQKLGRAPFRAPLPEHHEGGALHLQPPDQLAPPGRCREQNHELLRNLLRALSEGLCPPDAAGSKSRMGSLFPSFLLGGSLLSLFKAFLGWSSFNFAPPACGRWNYFVPQTGKLKKNLKVAPTLKKFSPF